MPEVRPIKVKRDVNDRAGIIGGSSAGACLGFSTYKTPYDVYLDFTGQTPPVSPEQQEIFDMGHALESFIAKRAEKKYQVKVRRDNFAYVHPEHPFIICHPDRIVGFKVDGKTIGMEIKSSSAYDTKRWGKEDTDEIPYDYLVQCHMYMACNVCDEVWLIRFSNNRLTRYIIEKNEQLEKQLTDSIAEWVDKVNSGWIPPIEDYDTAVKVFSDPDGEMEADEMLEDLIEEWREVSAQKKEISDKEDKLKAMIVSSIGNKSVVRSSTGEKLCQYKKITTTKLDTKRLKEDQPKLYSAYQVESSYMRLM